jgi:hypothetical protein
MRSSTAFLFARISFYFRMTSIRIVARLVNDITQGIRALSTEREL